MEKIVQKKITDGRTEDLTRAASGIILHSFIAGWDRSECLNVFNSLSRMYNLHSLVNINQFKLMVMTNLTLVSF